MEELEKDTSAWADNGGRRDRDAWIQEEVENQTGWLVIGFEYEMDELNFYFLDNPHYSVVFKHLSRKYPERITADALTIK